MKQSAHATDVDPFEQLRAVMDLLPVGVLLLRGESLASVATAACNAAYATMVGETPGPGSALRSLSFAYYGSDRVQPLRREELPGFRAILSGEVIRDRELHLRRGDGTWRVVIAGAAPVKHEGRTVGAVVICQDITAQQELQEALRASEDRARAHASELEALLDAVPAAVFITRDPLARRIEGNRVCAEMLGIPPGQNISASAPLEERPGGFRVTRGGVELGAEELPVQRAARGSEVRDFEFTLERADGVVRHFLGNAAPLRGDGGTPRGAVAAFVDITERKRAEAALVEREEWFRGVVETIPHAVWVGGPDGAPEFNNARLAEYTGLSANALMGNAWTEAIHPDDVGGAIEVWKRSLSTGEPFSYLERIRGRDGVYRWFIAAGSPLRDRTGRIVRWIGTWTDVDARVRAEEALREADRRKDAFLGMLSHELRNPLAPIRNSIYILQHADPAGPQSRRAMAVIERQSEHLTRLVDDLLDVTRIARGKIELRRDRVDVVDLVRRAGEDHRSLLIDRGLELAVAVPEGRLWVDGDATRLTQVIGNLLQNAAKFTPREGRVTLEVCADAAWTEIRVADTGVGIDPGLLPQIFEPFVQGDRSLARARGGLGLGLALVKGIVELHGGTVGAGSDGLGQGAEFVARLPLAAPPAEPVRGSDAPRAERRHRVLVVDDNVDAAESLAQLAEMFGHEVEVAYDGPSALRKARAAPPSVILCDIGLPGMSGYDVARALRNEPTLAHAQLIAVSGYAQPEDRKAAAEAGFDGHLAKPVDPAHVERLLS